MIEDDPASLPGTPDGAALPGVAGGASPSPTSPRDPRSLPPWFNRAVAVVIGWIVLLVAVAWVLIQLRTLVIIVLVALFLSLAMEPAVDGLSRRGWRRGPATGLVLGGVLVATLVFLAAAGSIVVGQVNDFVDNAPRYVRDFERFVNDDLGIEFDADELVREIREGSITGRATDFIDNAFDVALFAGRSLLQIFTVLIFAFYMTADGPRMRRVICSRLPRARQEVVLDTWEIAITKTGGYLYSRGIQAAISAFATWCVLFVLDIPYSLALALWVGVISQFIPTIGTYIALVLPVLVALKESPVKALIVLGFLVVYQQFENYLLGPRVTRHTMAVHPAIAIGTVFAGGLLFGAVGALLALPFTAVVQAVVSTYTTERAVIERRLTREQAPPGTGRRRSWSWWRRRGRDDQGGTDGRRPGP